MSTTEENETLLPTKENKTKTKKTKTKIIEDEFPTIKDNDDPNNATPTPTIVTNKQLSSKKESERSAMLRLTSLENIAVPMFYFMLGFGQKVRLYSLFWTILLFFSTFDSHY